MFEFWGLKVELCAGCALTLSGLGVLLHGVYFALAFVSVATGAFLGCVGMLQWFKEWRDGHRK